jgi:hypothetical protein
VPPVELPEHGSFDSVSVLSGIIYKIRVELLSEIACSQKTVMDVEFDTCGGCNPGLFIPVDRLNNLN